jgi:predicted GH43/DUF377 family glycosyl hydrolase
MIDNLVKLVLNKGGLVSDLKIPSTDSGGTGLCNPSIFVDKDGTILLNLRNVGYALYLCENEQKFQGRWGPLSYLHPENDCYLRTTNFLCTLDPKTLEIISYKKVDTSELDIIPVWDFIGLEDARVVKWNGILYITGVRRDTKTNGEGRMELSEIDNVESSKEISRVRIEPPNDPDSYCEKNWMPINDMDYHYIKWANPLEIVKVNPINGTSETVITKTFKEVTDGHDMRGGSSVVKWKEYRLCVIHEVDFWQNENDNKDGIYNHRIIAYDEDWNIVKYSDVFKFMTGRIEFVCGAAVIENDLVITYGYHDNAAFALRIPENVLEELLNG